jgi:hypothetical protein
MSYAVKTASRPNALVIVRAGDNSRHPAWIGNGIDPGFDLWVSYYGSGKIPLEQHCSYTERVKGPKWGPIHSLLEREWSRICCYDYVWLPDDDLAADAETLRRLFFVCSQNKFELAQPALTPESFFSHFITVRRRGLTFRWTNFVEVMAPCFRIDVLDSLRHTFTESVSGWGLDLIWYKIRRQPQHGFAIIDAAPVRHTRPIHGGSLYSSIEAKMSATEEMMDVRSRYDVKLELKEFGGELLNGLVAPGWVRFVLGQQAKWATEFYARRRVQEQNYLRMNEANQ